MQGKKYLLCLDYQIVSEKAMCGGNQLWDCRRLNAAKCAESCRNVSSMFAFARKGSNECGADNKCQCVCLLEADNGSCQQKVNNAFDLYAYSSQIKVTKTQVIPIGEIPSKLL